jgi:glycosyltransferase involved in cell wall biosynthesis
MMSTRAEVSAVDGLPFVGIRRGRLRGIKAVIKRGIDIVISALALAMLSLLLLAFRVTPYGIDSVFRDHPDDGRPRIVAERPRMLFPGAPIARKNLSLVLRAMAVAPMGSRLAAATLSISGAAEADFPDQVALAASLGVQSRISWLGVVDHARLPEVLAGADLLVYPSRQ